MVTKKFIYLMLFAASLCLGMLEAKSISTSTDYRPGIQSLIKTVLELDLTTDQQKQIKETLTQRGLKTQELQSKAVEALESYLQESLKKNTNKSTLVKYNQKVQNLYEDLRDYQLETWLLLRAQLTDEQLKKIKDKQELSFQKLDFNKNKKGVLNLQPAKNLKK